ncbi:MAG TPA: DUF2397 family protein [Chloroflexota bacterium]|nr:DUF2397 family protein [Chloroflexota bacterium]
MTDGPVTINQEASSPAPSQFPLQARQELRSLFAYLQAPQRADYYQAIVRVFLKNARRYYKIYLTVEQVAAEIAALYQDYSVDKCRVDLDQLEIWGNVVKTFDTAQRHTTIDSFLHPTVLYRATPATLEIEETYLRLEGQTETVGELRRGDLDHLVELFDEVDALVSTMLESESTDDLVGQNGGRELAETWRRLADHARTILDNTSRYIQTLAIARQEAASSDLDGYVRYKQQVVEYVRSFAVALERVSAHLQRRFRAWEETGGQERILTALAEHYVAPVLLDVPLAERRREAISQLGAVADWFRGPEWAEYFGRAARHEMNAVLQRAQLLAATSNRGAGFLTDLETLARRLLATTETEAAAQTLAVAFAHAAPRLISEHQSNHLADLSDPWEDDATLSLIFQPIQRGTTTPASQAAPVRDRRMIEELRQDEIARRQERLARLERLFGWEERAIADLILTDDEDARLVIEVLRHCLFDVDHRWRSDDGSIVHLLNPDERTLVMLRGPRGAYVLPSYRFRRFTRARRPAEVAHVS